MTFANSQEIASLIDHTLLKPEATESDILEVCKQALEHEFVSVCVNSSWISLVSEQLNGSKVRACSVVGFPLGAMLTAAKVEETRLALRHGASEIDMVINVGALRSSKTDVVFDEIKQLAEVAHASSAILKVILETCLLTDEEKRTVCQVSKEAGADFVKTSTGFSKSGATEADVALMRAAVGPDMGVKASGGVRSLEVLIRMVQAGATRIGSSSGVQILSEFRGGSH